MTKITLHEQYILVETEDINFSLLRQAVNSVIIEHVNSANTAVVLQKGHSE